MHGDIWHSSAWFACGAETRLRISSNPPTHLDRYDLGCFETASQSPLLPALILDYRSFRSALPLFAPASIASPKMPRIGSSRKSSNQAGGGGTSGVPGRLPSQGLAVTCALRRQARSPNDRDQRPRSASRRRVHHADDAMARSGAQRLVWHRRRSGFVVMKRPAEPAP